MTNLIANLSSIFEIDNHIFARTYGVNLKSEINPLIQMSTECALLIAHHPTYRTDQTIQNFFSLLILRPFDDH